MKTQEEEFFVFVVICLAILFFFVLSRLEDQNRPVRFGYICGPNFPPQNRTNDDLFGGQRNNHYGLQRSSSNGYYGTDNIFGDRGRHTQVQGILSESKINQTLKELQQTILHESKEEGSLRVREAQKLILMKREIPTEYSLHCSILIGVDATPCTLGGYCINLREKNVEYYAIKMKDFPWRMVNTENPDPNEFEMKNLQFALALWSDLIIQYKSFRLYTDNSAIKNGGNEFGVDAIELINHFTKCEKAKLHNISSMHINRKLDFWNPNTSELGLVQFAKFIQPADDFSRWEIEKGIEFLSEFYGIDKQNFKGTSRLTRKVTHDKKAWYGNNVMYRQNIMKAKRFALNFNCKNCRINAFPARKSIPHREEDIFSFIFH